ncbi:MAG: hypothetical protein KGL42_13570 [Betaproteobacteria bacterium]|nr:hypothetical protein [Betaproteobacteria bacterium]
MAQTISSKSIGVAGASLALNDPAAADRLARIAQVYIDHLGMCRLEPVTIQAVAEAHGFDAIVVDDDGQGYIALVAGEQLPARATYRLSGRVHARGGAVEELFMVEHSRAGLEQSAARIGYYVHIMRRLTH